MKKALWLIIGSMLLTSLGFAYDEEEVPPESCQQVVAQFANQIYKTAIPKDLDRLKGKSPSNYETIYMKSLFSGSSSVVDMYSVTLSFPGEAISISVPVTNTRKDLTGRPDCKNLKLAGKITTNTPYIYEPAAGE